MDRKNNFTVEEKFFLFGKIAGKLSEASYRASFVKDLDPDGLEREIKEGRSEQFCHRINWLCEAINDSLEYFDIILPINDDED